MSYLAVSTSAENPTAEEPTAPAAVPVRTQPYPPPPLTRWGVTWRYLVASLLSLYMLLNLLPLIFARPEHHPLSPWLIGLWGFAEIGGLIANIVLVRFRRRWPSRIALLMIVISSLSMTATGYSSWSFISLCTRMRWREILQAGGVWFVVGATQAFVVFNLTGVAAQLPSWATTLFVIFTAIMQIASLATYIAIGIGIGSQRRDVAMARERAEQAEREQSLRVAQGQTAERARIAREMHDVVAHRMSLVAMHAGALAYRTDLEPEKMREVARGIQENATAALTELRSVLADLREDAQPSGPQPSLTELGALIEGLRTQGMRIDVAGQVHGIAELAPAQSRHAYRIVQEALTNARKHAVNAPVRVEVSGTPKDGMSLEIRNPRTYTASVPGGGLGLVGLRERAELAGGTMWAGTEKGDFVVRAWLPWSK